MRRPARLLVHWLLAFDDILRGMIGGCCCSAAAVGAAARLVPWKVCKQFANSYAVCVAAFC